MKKWIKNLLITACLLIAGICIGFIVLTLVNRNNNSKIYDALKENVKTTESDESLSEITETIEAVQKETSMENGQTKIDFDALQSVNPDIYAWIEIPSTKVDYPVVQSSTDDFYYLNHTVEGAVGYPGSIYTERKNHKDFSDFNTLIYGHDMLDGSMFHELHNYEEAGFMSGNPYIYIYTPGEKLTYRIFAASVYDDRHILLSYDFGKTEDRQAFLESLQTGDNRNTYDPEVSVTPEDKIITLSTCIGDEGDRRYLVAAVLQNEE